MPFWVLSNAKISSRTDYHEWVSQGRVDGFASVLCLSILFFCLISSRTLYKWFFKLLLFFNHGKFHTYTVERMVWWHHACHPHCSQPDSVVIKGMCPSLHSFVFVSLLLKYLEANPKAHVILSQHISVCIRIINSFLHNYNASITPNKMNSSLYQLIWSSCSDSTDGLPDVCLNEPPNMVYACIWLLGVFSLFSCIAVLLLSS